MNIWDVLLPLLLLVAGWLGLQRAPWWREDPLHSISQRTVSISQQLVQTKYFRIIRLNINQECPLGIMNRICKSHSCTVCRCNDRDIPQFWANTQKVKIHLSEGDLWELQRGSEPSGWVWHVEDEANDRGQYFDIHTNIQSFTNYNGGSIWKLIYEENCFHHSYYEEMCAQEKILFNIISGLHTSISTHLSRFYKHTVQQNAWADLTMAKQEGKFNFNTTEYKERVLDHPDRIRNLLFLYRILAKAINKAAPYLKANFTIASDDFAQDVEAKRWLSDLLGELQGYDLSTQQKQSLKFFTPDNPMVKQYQRYIHNISNIMNCVQCQKCRLFGKMQTYGVGTALKILLGYPTPYKRNEMVALFNVFNKVSMSVDTYYNNRKQVIALGYERTSQRAKELYVVVGGILAAIYIWRRYKAEFGDEKGQGGAGEERKIE